MIGPLDVFVGQNIVFIGMIINLALVLGAGWLLFHFLSAFVRFLGVCVMVMHITRARKETEVKTREFVGRKVATEGEE